MKDYYFIVIEKPKNNIATIRINRPEARNRIDRATMVEFVEALDELNSDPDIAAVIITGTGDDFCAGGQIDGFPVGSIMEQREYSSAFIDMQRKIYKMNKPVIAAVQGDAICGGVSVIEACDLAVAGSDCKFGLIEITNGLFPMLALAVMQKGLPKKRVFELAYTGKLIDAETMEKWNLINYVVPQDQVMDRTIELASLIAEYSSVALDFGRDCFYRMVDMSLDSALEISKGMLLNLLETDDAKEASFASKEGRKPVFTGK